MTETETAPIDMVLERNRAFAKAGGHEGATPLALTTTVSPATP